MTDKVNMFNDATAALKRAAGYRRGMAQVYNLTEAFQRRGVAFGAMDPMAGQNEK